MDLFTADLHLSDNPRDAYRLDFVQQRLPALIAEHGVDRLVLLGDLTELKDRHSDWLVNQIADALTALARECQLVVLRGNHDYLADPTQPFFRFLAHMQGIRYINRPTRAGDRVLLPHTRNWQRDWQNLDFSGVKLILTHATFRGAIANHDVTLDGIPREALPLAIPVVSGDVHRPQDTEATSYVGAPYRIDFGDDYDPRVLLFDGAQFEAIELPPCKHRVYAATLPQLPEQLRQLPRGDMVRIELGVRQEDYAGWSELQRQARQLADGLQVDSVLPVVAATATAARNERRRSAPSDAQLLKEYCQARGVDTATAKVGQELL